MVNIRQQVLAPAEQCAVALEQYLNHQLGSLQLIQITENLLYSLLEGEYRNEQAIDFIQLREILSDITTQWECLLGNLHDQQNSLSIELPREWVENWLKQITAIVHPDQL
jgi:hypothetical protein